MSGRRVVIGTWIACAGAAGIRASSPAERSGNPGEAFELRGPLIHFANAAGFFVSFILVA